MSLLNDMLRDLSHQQATNNTAAATNQATLDFNAQEQRELFYNTSAAKPLRHTMIPSLIVFVVVVFILALWKWSTATPENIYASTKSIVTDQANILLPPVQTELTKTDLIQTTKMLEAVAPEAPVTHTPQSTSEEVVDSYSVTPALGEQIAALESAISHLSVVVANANNPVVNKLDGMQARANQPVAAAENSTSSITTEISESVSIQEPFIPKVAEPLADSVLPAVEQGESILTITPNAKWKDQQQSQQANQLVAQGQVDVAIETLRSFIEIADQPRESLKTLLDIFAVQKNTDAMQALLAQINYLSVVEQTFYAAKIASIKNEDAQAIQLLEANLDGAERDENYRALLAGLYQRGGMHLEAANHYRRLLNVFGDKPAYWLGFALAQDALNQPLVAVQAFQRVNQNADLQPQVRTYVQQRIAALKE